MESEKPKGSNKSTYVTQMQSVSPKLTEHSVHSDIHDPQPYSRGSFGFGQHLFLASTLASPPPDAQASKTRDVRHTSSRSLRHGEARRSREGDFAQDVMVCEA